MTPVASWWGYAEADSAIVGILVATICLLAVLYVVRTAWRGRNSGIDSRFQTHTATTTRAKGAFTHRVSPDPPPGSSSRSQEG